MHKTHLRKVGGSVMLVVPPAILDILQLRPGAQVGLTVDKNRLILEPQQRPRYTVDQLLAQCKPKARHSRADREWLGSRPVGSELI
ncbi:MAG: AbrB/MazE/SpoVT family DNA-binding domain-containing protein [Bryobacteraceae bacterium]